MRQSTETERTALFKAQKGYRLVKEGLLDVMAIARTANDVPVLLAASEAMGEAIAAHARAGQSVMAQFSDGPDIVMHPDGGGGGR